MKRSMAEGKKIIGVRWVDVNKGDETKDDYRSRLVAKEINTGKRPDLFAGTPPLESLRYLASSCARQGGRGGSGIRMMFNDVRRAYFFAEAKRDIYVELLEEDREYDEYGVAMVGKLNLSMYGTRDAAQNWSIEYCRTLVEMGFIQGVASSCHFYHPEKKLRCVTISRRQEENVNLNG